MKDRVLCTSIKDWPKTRLVSLKNVEDQNISMTVNLQGHSKFFKKGKHYSVEFREIK